MVASQELDMEGTQNLVQLTQMYTLKTGSLIKASVMLGLIAANHQSTETRNALKKFADHLGLAFQLQDDLLDLECDTAIGKPQQIDDKNKKFTYLALQGLDATRKKIQELINLSLQSIEFLGEKADILRN